MSLRVLMISSLWPPEVLGGAELYAAELASRLRVRGDTVGAVTCGVDGPDTVVSVPSFPYRVDAFEAQGPARRALFHVADLHRRQTARSLRDAVDRFAPDVIHSHAVAGLSVTALSTPARLGVPHVHTAHDYWLLCRRSTLVQDDGTFCDGLCGPCALRTRVHERALATHHPDVVLAVSDASAAEHARLRWARDRVQVLHHAVPEVEPLPPRPSQRPPVFGFLGRLSEAKGARTLVRAVDGLGDRTRLDLAGDGPLREELEAASGPGVRFLGWVDGADKRGFFAAIDCLVVPSELREPAGLVVNEARAYGVPVIASRVGGVPELVPAASRPLLFAAGDVADLRARLLAFAADPERYREPPPGPEVGWDAHVDAVHGAYQAAISRHAGDPSADADG